MQISDEMVELAESYIAGGKCFNDPEACSHMDCACRTQMRAALVAALPMIRGRVVDAEDRKMIAWALSALQTEFNLSSDDYKRCQRLFEQFEPTAAIRAIGGDK